VFLGLWLHHSTVHIIFPWLHLALCICLVFSTFYLFIYPAGNGTQALSVLGM
jgi:hypothetical protein